MDPVELNYTVTEKEFLIVIYSINKLRHCITGYPTFVHTDYSSIRYLMNKPVTNARVTRWLLLLQKFDITIIDKLGKDNVVADFISLITNNDDNSAVEDSFLEKHLFAVLVHSPWYVDIANYLVVGKIPSHLSKRERRRIVQHSARYYRIDRYVFYTRLDMEIRRCVREDEIHSILKPCHDEPCGGHFADKKNRHKVLRMDYFWPTLFHDAKKYVQACDNFEEMGQPNIFNETPL